MVKKLKWISNAQKIRDYVAKHKDAKPKDIAAALNLNTQYVYQVLHKMKKPAVVDTVPRITPERMAELVYQHTRPKHRMQSAVERPAPDIVAGASHRHGQPPTALQSGRCRDYRLHRSQRVGLSLG